MQSENPSQWTILEPLYYSSFVFATLVYGVIGYKFCWLLPHSRSTSWTWINWYTNWARISCFTSKISRLKSWMKLQIWESFVSHSIRALTLVSQRKLGITSRNDLFVSLEELYSYFFLFPREKRKHISSLCGFQGERSQNISLWFFRERILIKKDFT